MNLLDVMRTIEQETNKDVLLHLIHTHGPRCDSLLSYVRPEFKEDIDVVRASIQIDPRSIRYASDKLRNEYELALSIVKQNGRCLQYLGDTMRLHPTIVTEAIRQHGDAIYYVPEEMYTISEISECARCHGI